MGFGRQDSQTSERVVPVIETAEFTQIKSETELDLKFEVPGSNRISNTSSVKSDKEKEKEIEGIYSDRIKLLA